MRATMTGLRCAGVLLALSGSALAEPAVGRPAPRLVVETLDGAHFDLSALHGKVVLVNLWATWCPPCREELPALDQLYARYHSEGVELLGLSADRKRDKKNVLAMVRGLHYPVAFASEAAENGFGTPSVLPITYLVAPDGVLRAVFLPTAKLSVETLEAAVEPLLPKGPLTDAPATDASQPKRGESP